MIPYAKHSIDDEDIEAVVEVLKSDWLTQGPAISQFESALSEELGVKNSVVFANGTAALHIACAALGLTRGDVLWTSPISFVASANCARYCGAEVDFVDIDPETKNISILLLAEKLSQAKAENRLPKILVPVHFSGLPCDMEAIAELAREYKFFVIEDAAHALGAVYRDSKIGACRYSDATIFSFHPAKHITSGEGGAVTTASEELALKMKLLGTHGITRDTEKFLHSAADPWVYEQQNLGFNYRMSDIHAALGISQLKKLGAYIQRRKAIAARYHELLSRLPIKTLVEPEGHDSAWHIYPIELNSSAIRPQVFNYMREQGIGVNVHYIPIHQQPYYQSLGFQLGDFPASEAYYRAAITLPIYPTLTDGEQDKVVACLEEGILQCR